jgi:hypothetical protein
VLPSAELAYETGLSAGSIAKWSNKKSVARSFKIDWIWRSWFLEQLDGVPLLSALPRLEILAKLQRCNTCPLERCTMCGPSRQRPVDPQHILYIVRELTSS